MARGASAGPAILFGLLAVIGIMAAVVAAVTSRSSSETTSTEDGRDPSSSPAAPGPTGPTRPTGPSYWHASCLVDANGDGTLDIAGLAGLPGSSARPAIVDGETGKVLFMDETLDGPKLFCVSKDWILVGAADFEIRLYNARHPDPPNRARGSDKIRHARLGKDCISIRTDDDETMGLALPSGTVTHCGVELPRYASADRPGILGLTAEETRIARGSRTLIFRKKRSGSGKLSLEVAEAGRTTLNLQLPYVSPTFAAGIAATNEYILFTGAKPGKKDQGLLVGLTRNGDEIYNHALPGKVTDNIHFMAFNNRFVLVEYWSALRAYVPKTGKLAWIIGLDSPPR